MITSQIKNSIVFYFSFLIWRLRRSLSRRWGYQPLNFWYVFLFPFKYQSTRDLKSSLRYIGRVISTTSNSAFNSAPLIKKKVSKLPMFFLEDDRLSGSLLLEKPLQHIDLPNFLAPFGTSAFLSGMESRIVCIYDGL